MSAAGMSTGNNGWLDHFTNPMLGAGQTATRTQDFGHGGTRQETVTNRGSAPMNLNDYWKTFDASPLGQATQGGGGLPAILGRLGPATATPAAGASPALPMVGSSLLKPPTTSPVQAATTPDALGATQVAPSNATASAASPPTAPAGTGTPGAALGTYGPGNDLQASTITPTNSALTNTAQGAVQQSLSSLDALPNRTALAQGNMALLQQQIGDQQRTGLQQIGQQAAALGRVGSGMTTSAYGDLADRLDVEQQRAASGLALDAASGQAQDAESRLGASESAYGQSAGLDAQNRNELRTERAYQTGQSQTAYNQQLQQVQEGDSLENSALSRALAEFSAGNSSGNLGNTLQNAAGATAAGAGNTLETIGQTALGIYAQQQQQPGQTAPYNPATQIQGQAPGVMQTPSYGQTPGYAYPTIQPVPNPTYSYGGY
ncbi:MAG TPA: hypothetical protein VGD56_16715 [Gemmatirosa sp.]